MHSFDPGTLKCAFDEWHSHLAAVALPTCIHESVSHAHILPPGILQESEWVATVLYDKRICTTTSLNRRSSHQDSSGACGLSARFAGLLESVHFL